MHVREHTSAAKVRQRRTRDVGTLFVVLDFGFEDRRHLRVLLKVGIEIHSEGVLLV